MLFLIPQNAQNSKFPGFQVNVFNTSDKISLLEQTALWVQVKECSNWKSKPGPDLSSRAQFFPFFAENSCSLFQWADWDRLRWWWTLGNHCCIVSRWKQSCLQLLFLLSLIMIISLSGKLEIGKPISEPTWVPPQPPQ